MRGGIKTTIEVLKEELREQNLLVNTTLLRNANDSSQKIDAELSSRFRQSL